MPVKESMGNEDPTYPCKICGRRFIQNSLVKHEPVCKKLSNLSRKPFDSGKQRANGSDISYADVKRAAKEKEKNGGIFPRPKTNWKERHETFIDAVSSSKKVDYAIKTGAPLPPPPKTAVPSDYPIPPPPKWVDNEATSDEDDFLNTTVYMETNDYVQCEYCGRNFNEKAAERHIPFCRDQNMRGGGGSLKPVAKPLTGHRLSTGRQEIKMREASPSRQTEMRWRGESREDTKNTPTSRRKSTDARPTPQSRHSPARNTSQSAGQRHTVVPPTPNKRSNSAPRTPAASRLKTPIPVASRMKMHS